MAEDNGDKGDLRTKSAREAIEVLTNKLTGYNRRDTTRQNKILEQQQTSSEKLIDYLKHLRIVNSKTNNFKINKLQTKRKQKQKAKNKI